MGYCILGQVGTMMRSVVCNFNLRVEENILRRFLMMPCALLLRYHLRSAIIIALVDSGRGTVDGLVGALWHFWKYMCPCPGPTRLPGNLCLIGIGRLGHRFDSWWLEGQPWSPCWGSASCWCLPLLVDWCLLHRLARWLSTSRGLLDCSGPTGLFQRGVPCTTSIIFRPFFCFPLHLLALP